MTCRDRFYSSNTRGLGMIQQLPATGNNPVSGISIETYLLKRIYLSSTIRHG